MSTERATAARWLRVFTVQRTATWLTAGIVIALVLVPLVTLLLASFRADGVTLPFDPGARFTLDGFGRVASDDQLWMLTRNTALFTAATLVVGIAISVLLAWIVERTDIAFRNLIFALVIAPIGIPMIVAGIAWSNLLAKKEGFVNTLLRGLFGLDGSEGPLNINTVYGMVFVEALIIVPFSFLLLTPVFRSMDPSLEEAAATSGAGAWGRLRRVVVPLLWPSLVAVVIYQFITVVQAFEIPVIIGLNADVRVFSTRVYEALQPTAGLPDYGVASIYSLLLLAVSLLPMIWYYRLIRRSERYTTVTGKGFRPRRLSLGRWRYPVYLFVGGYLLVAFVLPAVMMLWMSVQPFYTALTLDSLRRVNLDGYQALFTAEGLGPVVWNTTVLGVVSATLVTVLSVVHAWVLVRSRTRLSRVVDFLAFATHGIPGIVVGVSLLFGGLVLSRVTHIPLYGRVSILVIGMLIVTLGFATRILVSAVSRIHPELEEAALMCGASWRRTMTRIVGRLLMPAIVNTWVLAFVYAITNLSLTVILGTSQNRVLAVNLFTFWNFGKTQEAAAIAVILMLVSVVLTMIFRLRLGAGEER
ncbi:ABC transporter permease subunit [Jiangella mangrovi]|uniref:Iron(III) transport system permease protein n=1 Tax=Jiangella mangrovi TaxID=1524084 RepID=A0A7W9GUD5_9ACTN|nr:iron(III) transport system permease protein [Jiangella mangrovi]